MDVPSIYQKLALAATVEVTSAAGASDSSLAAAHLLALEVGHHIDPVIVV